MNLKILIILIGFGLLGTSGAEAEVLEYKFVQGASATYSISTLAVQTLSQQGAAFPATNTHILTLISSNEVITGGADSGVVRSTIDSLAVEVSSPVVSGSYDSATDATPEKLFAPMAALVGHPVDVAFDKLGKVTAVDGVAELHDAVIATQAGIGLEVNYDAKSIIDSIIASGSVIQLPTGDIEVGTSWSVDSTMDNPFVGTMSISTEYTYTGNTTINGYLAAAISFEVVVSSTNEASAKLMSVGGEAIATQMTVQAESSGTINLALNEGIIVSYDRSMVLTTTGFTTRLVQGKPLLEMTVSDTAITETMDLISYVE